MTNFKHDPKKQRYEVEVSPNYWALFDYRKENNTLIITHTFVPHELRGQKMGAVLMDTVLKDIEEKGQKVKPVCSYAVHYLNKTPNWQHLIA